LEGQTLKHRISGKPIELERVPEYGHQMADALEAAHSKAIIHRDIKPANISVTERGQVKLLDFGLAKRLPERKGAERAKQAVTSFGVTTQDAHLTSDGVALGTVAYMSPEQVRGLELDERTDLFSLGLVLYEMTTGQRAFTGNTSGVIFDGILNRTPTPPARLNPAIPIQLEQIIAKSLEKDRELRYRSASDIRADLQRLKRDTDSSRALPFKSGEASRQKLRRYWPHFVWAGVLAILLLLFGLNVGPILTGRLIQSGDDLTISVNLEDVTNNRQIWGEQYNRKLSNLVAVQQEIAGDIYGRLRPRLAGEERKLLAKRPTEDAEAYQLYLQGLFYWNKWTQADFKKAADFFTQAVEKDQHYALSYAGLADTYSLLGDAGYLPPSEAWPKSKAAAMQALDIDDSLAEAHTSLGLVKEHFEWDWAGAEQEFKHAIELNPNLATAHHRYGDYLTNMGRFEEGMAQTKKAQELDPLSLIINTTMGWQFYVAGQNENAVEQLRKVLDIDAKFSPARRTLEEVYAHMGKQKEAVAEREKALSLSGGAELAASIEEDFNKSGYKGVLQSWLDGLTELSKHSYVSSCSIAESYMRMGEKQKAFEWLEKAYEEHDSGLVSLAVEPMFESLRTDPRFKEIVRRMKLPH